MNGYAKLLSRILLPTDTPARQEALAADILEVAEESHSFTLANAAITLLQRIGGPDNLRPYVDSLVAGRDK